MSKQIKERKQCDKAKKKSRNEDMKEKEVDNTSHKHDTPPRFRKNKPIILKTKPQCFVAE